MASAIIKEIMQLIPADKITDAVFEGANIVLYTNDPDFFLTKGDLIREVVQTIKKRVELRPDPSLCINQEKAAELIKKILPEEAGIAEILFDPRRSIVIIEAEKPGVAIGKQASVLHEIKAQTRWVPIIQRTPAIRSKIIENIRSVLYEESDYRRKFLDKVGHRVYDGPVRGKKQEWVRITFLGAARTVGRSCFLLQTQESRVLLDCGLNMGSTEDMYPILDVPEFQIQELDAVILTHSHLDHCGFIPYLYKYGFKGPTYCTAPTRDVSALQLLDFVKIAKSENRDPLYETDHVKEMVKHMVTLDFEEVTDITPDLRLTFYNAGHILGSAQAHINVGNGFHNIVYTGDLKFGKTPLMDPAHCNFPRVETLIIEGTYGLKTKVMPSQQEMDEMFISVVKETVARGGKVLMPVLGSGRAQDLLMILDYLIKSGGIPPLPVYIDGIVWDITAIHTAYPEYLNSTIRKSIFHKDENPFLNENFKRVGSVKERDEILHYAGPCVVLATSGMMVGGPSVEYFKNLATDARNTIVFSSYLPEGTLGHRILNGEKEFIFKNGNKPEVISQKMSVYRLEISDHSDRKQLMSYVYRVSPKPKKLIVVHGEVSSCLDLASSVHKQNNIETVAPRMLETVRLK